MDSSQVGAAAGTGRNAATGVGEKFVEPGIGEALELGVVGWAIAVDSVVWVE